MITRLEIEGLNGLKGQKVLDFHPDINIITGNNGVGKTTILKIIWYMYSGNITRLLNEITFSEIKLYLRGNKKEFIYRIIKETEEDFNLEIEKKKVSKNKKKNLGYEIEIRIVEGNEMIFTSKNSEIETCERMIAKWTNSSLFFPTFRRVEGFSIKDAEKRFYKEDDTELILERAMNSISRNISKVRHKYVTSVSTKDIKILLNSRFTKVTDEINQEYINLSSKIENMVKPSNDFDESYYKNILNSISEEVSLSERRRKDIFEPIEKIKSLVEEIFNKKAIKVNEVISYGQSTEAIDSEYLSAGEKQMLSFVVYNALYSYIPIIIDEPEISLHGDWQRLLLPILLSQKTNNQFIIATHSPFIYTKYPDKEIIINF